MESDQGTNKEFARTFLMGQLGRRNRNPSEKTRKGGSNFVFSAQNVQTEKVERKLPSSSSSGIERRASFVKKNPEKVHYGIEVQSPSPFDVAASRNNNHSTLQSSSTESLQDRYHQAVQMVKNDTSKPILSNKWQVGLKTNVNVCDTLVQKGYSKVSPPTPILTTPESPKGPTWNPPQSKSTYRPTREFMKPKEQVIIQPNGNHENGNHNNGFNNGYHTSNGLSVNGRSSSSEDDQKQQHNNHVVQHKVAVKAKQPINVVISKTSGRKRIVVTDTHDNVSVERKPKEKKDEEERLHAEKRKKEEQALAEKRAEEERLLAEKKAEEERALAEKRKEEERLLAEKKAEEEQALVEKRKEEERFLTEADSGQNTSTIKARRKIIVGDHTKRSFDESPKDDTKNELQRMKEAREKKKKEEQEKRKAEQEKRKAELEKKSAERKAEQEKKEEERKHKAELKKAEDERKAEEKRLKEEKLAAEKEADELEKAEELKKANDAKIKAEKIATEKKVKEEKEKENEVEKRKKEEIILAAQKDITEKEFSVSADEIVKVEDDEERNGKPTGKTPTKQ